MPPNDFQSDSKKDDYRTQAETNGSLVDDQEHCSYRGSCGLYDSEAEGSAEKLDRSQSQAKASKGSTSQPERSETTALGPGEDQNSSPFQEQVSPLLGTNNTKKSSAVNPSPAPVTDWAANEEIIGSPATSEKALANNSHKMQDANTSWDGVPHSPPLLPSKNSDHVYVDACDIGIGFFFANRWEAWRLRPGWRETGTREIQWAEAAAVDLGVRLMIEAGYAGKEVILHSDNLQVVEAVSQLHRIGPKKSYADQVVNSVIQLCQDSDVHLNVEWIRGENNRADGVSRLELEPSDGTRLQYHVEIPSYLQDVVIPYEN